MKGMYLLWGDAKIKYAEAIREPASIEISIAEITTDETDPALIRPMVIRPGGVKILFRSSYTDKIDMVSWERFGNCKLSYEKIIDGTEHSAGIVLFGGTLTELLFLIIMTDYANLTEA